MFFTELLVVAMALGTTTFAIHSFFSYLKFRRTNPLGGNQTDLEELAAAFQQYINKTNRRIEHLEAIQAGEPMLKKGELNRHLDQVAEELEQNSNRNLTNRLEQQR